MIEEWLQSTAGQLTVYGLATLHEQVCGCEAIIKFCMIG